MASQSPRTSNASRYFFLFLVGLAVGAMCTVMALRALQARKDHFPDSVMQVMSKHSALLGDSVKQNRCAATDTVPHVRALRVMANDLELAFPDLADDERFRGHTSQFRARLDQALSTPPTTCAAATEVAQSIGETCKACHQDFRG